MSEPSVEQRWIEYERLGPQKVRQRIAAGVYGPNQRAAAREWLNHLESLRIAESSRAQILIARKARNAAWAAAVAAIIAAIAAVTAVSMSLGWRLFGP